MKLGFGCNVIYWTKSGDKHDSYADFVSFDELLSRSDFISVHCALTPDTKHIFDSKTFSKMKTSSIFINSTRGDVVNQDDLYDALKNGTIYAAGRDVTTPEPLPTSHKLLTLPNCTILPHIGSATEVCRNNMAELAIRNLFSGLENKKLSTHL
jgi:glyoxylate/hydroxypyruvate reductase